MTGIEASGSAAEDRVQQFMIEFNAQWRIAAPEFTDPDPDDPRRAFAVWHDLMDQTMAKHFTDSPTTASRAASQMQSIARSYFA